MVLVVDREPVYQAGEVAILAAAGIAAHPVTVESCAARATRADVRALVLDSALGRGAYGVDLVAEVAAAAPRVPVILVIGPTRAGGLVGLLEAGVRALVHRRCTAAELVAAVGAAQAGRNWVSRPLAGPLRDELLAEASGERIEPLTNREREVLRALAGGGTNLAIGHQLGISEHTVRNHLRAIMGKLGVASRTDAVATAARRGLVDLSD